MIDQNNPAGRLLKILSRIKLTGNNMQVRQGWARVFDCNENDNIEITKKVMALYNLSQETQNLIKINPDINHQLYLISFPKLEQALFPLNPSASWQPQKQLIDDELIARLQFCAEELSKYYSEEEISKEDFEDIKKKVEELFQLVSSSDIAGTLKTIIMEELEKIRSSIAMYEIRGAKGVKEALQSTLGAVVANQQSLTSIASGHGDILKRLAELLDKVDTISSKALKIHRALRKPVQFLLEQIGNDNDEKT